MRRDASGLRDRTFDLLVVGAGIQGVCVAWDACLRGLSVALVDRGDFGGATSANSLGIVHGGLRYLVRGDFPRMLESIRERSALLRIAPDLVEPLPVLIPTYEGIGNGKAALRAGLLVNDLVSRHRNRGLEPHRVIPRARLVSRDECLRLFPWFSPGGLSGGALWYDGLLTHPERLTLAFVRSAAEHGAVAANYVEVDQLLLRDGKAEGARATDLDRGGQFEIRARCVVVAAGPWTPGLIAGTLGYAERPPASGRALAVNVCLDRSLSDVAIGVKASTGPDQDPVCGGGRFLFAAPRAGKTVLGTWYTVDALASPEAGVRSLVQEFNQACPGPELSISQVSGYQWGWLPLKGPNERGRATALAERPRLVNHAVADRVQHLLSVEAVKYTTARSVAERVVDWVFADLGRVSPPCRTAEVHLDSSAVSSVPGREGALSRSDVRRAVHQEMALRLSDIVFRRTSLGTSARLDRTAVADVAHMAGTELGWDGVRQEAEIDDVMHQRSVPAQEPVG